MQTTIERGLLIACVLLSSPACQQNELGMAEIVRIAEKRLNSETLGYRCKEINYENNRLDSERGKRIAETRKKGDHVLSCEPSLIEKKDGWVLWDGQKIVFVSKHGVFQY